MLIPNTKNSYEGFCKQKDKLDTYYGFLISKDGRRAIGLVRAAISNR
jgi:hypothetical protein